MRFFATLSLVLIFSISGLSQSNSSSSSSNDIPPCPVDVRWLNTNGSLTQTRSSELPVNLSFLVHMSGGSPCSNAEITATATYLTDTQDFICSGTIRSAMTVSSKVQTFNIAVRPFMQLDFLRWRNQPGLRGEQQGKRLECKILDGTSDVGDTERQKAGWMRLSIGVIPTSGGLAVTEAIFRLVP